jgi:hypothetical protein
MHLIKQKTLNLSGKALNFYVLQMLQLLQLLENRDGVFCPILSWWIVCLFMLTCGKGFVRAGLQWHPILWTDQSNCTKSELPNFVRNFYDNCRGPPRLFLLDKFDVAGEGACMKRYTDPSFYKTMCTGSVFKGVCHQSRFEKEKERQCKSGEETLGSFLHFRKQSSSLRSKNEDVSGAVSSKQMEQDNPDFAQQQDMAQDLGQDANEPCMTREIGTGDVEVANVSSSSLDFPEQNETQVNGENGKNFLEEDEEEFASDGEHFMDALATMDSEVESEDSETQALPDVVSSVANSMAHTESPREKLSEGLGLNGANLQDRTRLLGKELLEASSLEGLNAQEDLQLQEEENVGFTPMSLLEVDDDLGFEKCSPSFLKDFAPSSLNHFAHRANMESAREKVPEALGDLQEKLPKSCTGIEERLQAGFGPNEKAPSSTHLPVHLQASKGESGRDSFGSCLVSLSEATESLKDLSGAHADADIKETGSILVEERETVEYTDKKQTKFVPYRAVPNGIAKSMDTTTTATTSNIDDNSSSEYRRSIEEIYNPFTSSSTSMSYSESESPSRESVDFSPLHSPLMSPWSHLSLSCVYFDSSESDDSFRIHSVQSPPLDPLVAPLPIMHSTAQKHSEAQLLVVAADAVVT